MRLLVDKTDGIFVTTKVVRGETRRYYEDDTTLIVVRGNMKLENLRNQVVDANVGWDIVRSALFTRMPHMMGEKRIKITIYARVNYFNQIVNRSLHKVL